MDFSDIGAQSYQQSITTGEIIDTNTLFPGQLIRIDETPNQPNWKLVPLFLEGIQGDIRVWQIGFDQSKCHLQIVHGILVTTKGIAGENLQTEYHSINKSETHGTLEARRRYLNKYNEGYLPTGEELSPDLNGAKPMLAKIYRHPLDNTNEGKLKSNETRIKKFPISVMRKIDGIRSLSRLQGNKIVMRSRLNNLFPHLHHIKKELEIFMKYLPPHCELDGELYSMNMNFQQLTSAIKRVNKLHLRHNEIQYWIFDIIDPQKMVWEDRYTMLVNSFIKYLEDNKTHNTFKILQAYTAMNPEQIDQYHDAFVAEGYEGIVIRRYGSVESDKRLAQYRPNRTNSLVKYKRFQDEEAIIVTFEKCNDTNTNKTNTNKTNTNKTNESDGVKISETEGSIKFIVKDIRNNEFPVKLRGNKIYDQKYEFIGKRLTIRFQGLSDKGIPRFPIGIAIRDYE